MTPDQLDDAALAAELRRRAAGASLGDDWAQRDLLPVIGAGIEAQSRRRSSSLAPALAGLAAALAVLAVLIVVAPKLGPGAGSPRPTREAPPSTIAAIGTREFEARLGELRGQTLLIIGEIVVEERHTIGGGCLAPPDAMCYVGTLAGSNIDLSARRVAIPETDEGSTITAPGVWSRWRTFAVPTGNSRVMAVKVDSSARVELLGYTDPDQIAMAFGEIPFVDFDALAPEEVQVVPAWMSGIVAPISCAPPDAGTYTAGLRNRYCSDPTWVTLDPVRFDPTGYEVPGSAIQVQSGAYLEFVSEPMATDGSAEPRAGAYVLAKRLEGWCDGNTPPCWRWEVIGRLTLVDDGNLAKPLSTPREIACTPAATEGASSFRSPSILDRTGLVVGCAVLAAATGEDVPLGVSNPDGDRLKLDVVWTGSSCDVVSRFTLDRTAGGFDLSVELLSYTFTVDCYADRATHAMRVDLSAPVSAESVSARIKNAPRVSFGVAPTPSPQRSTFDCTGPPLGLGITPDPGPVPRVMDETGLVEACSQIDVLPELDGAVSLSNLFEDRTIEVVWQDGTCDSSIEFTFGSIPPGAADNYFLQGIRPASCPTDSGALPIAIRLTQPVAADDVVASVVHPPERGMCRHFESGVVLQQPEFVDETGLVESCFSSDEADSWRFPTPVLENTDDRQLRIQISWVGSRCETDAKVTFARNGERYLVTIDQGSDVGDCERVAKRRIGLSLTQPVDDALVDVRFLPDGSTGATQAPPAASQIIDCTGAPLDFANGAVRIEDHSGLIRGCEASAIDFDGLPDASSTVDPPSITTTWAVPCATNSWRTLLQFWPQPEGAESPASPRLPYLLVADRKSPLEDGGCFTAMSGRQVRIDLATPIDWADIEQIRMEDGRGIATQLTDAGSFQMTLSPDASAYVTGQPIEISASLEYQGPEQAVTIGTSTEYVNFSVKQLDGWLETEPTSLLMCMNKQLTSGPPDVVPFVKTGGYASDDPHADFYRRYFEDPELRLPPGTYRISAGLGFYVGTGGCHPRDEPLYVLRSSIIVHVE